MEVIAIENLSENFLKGAIPKYEEATNIVHDFMNLLNVIHQNHKNKLGEYSQKENLDNHLKSLLEKKASLIAEFENITEQIEQRKKELEVQEKKLAVSSKSVSLFREYLGLKIKKSQTGEISFIFSQIDKEHPNHCCIFKLRVKENVYKLTKCVPELKNTEDLISELNRTNNLRSFVIRMREKFCNLLHTRS